MSRDYPYSNRLAIKKKAAMRRISALLPAPPILPEGARLEVSERQDSTLKFSWPRALPNPIAPQRAISYRLYSSRKPLEQDANRVMQRATLRQQLPPSVGGCTTRDLRAHTLYYFALVAIDEYENASLYPIVDFTTSPVEKGKHLRGKGVAMLGQGRGMRLVAVGSPGFSPAHSSGIWPNGLDIDYTGVGAGLLYEKPGFWQNEE